MKILVTGAAGYLGGQLTNHLLSKGHFVRAFDKMFYGAESLLFAANSDNLEIVKGDIRDENDLESALDSIDYVVHLAGIVGEPACNLDKEFAWEVNHDAAKKVVDVVNKLNIQKLIFVSTCSNYGVSSPNELVDESGKLNPLSDYAKAKVAVEEHILESCKVPFSILRLGTLCGLGARMRFDLLINEMSRCAALKEEIEVYSPEAWRPYLHIKDAARAIETIASADDKIVNGNIFNVVGQNLKKSDLVDIVLKHYPQTVIKVTDKAPDLRDYKVSGKKFNKTFFDFEENSVEKAFLEMAKSVEDDYFFDPKSSSHSTTYYKQNLK